MSSSKDNLTNFLNEDLEKHMQEHQAELDKIEVRSRKEVFDAFFEKVKHNFGYGYNQYAVDDYLKSENFKTDMQLDSDMQLEKGTDETVGESFEKNLKEHFINSIKKTKILNSLNGFKIKINNIGEHNSEAKQVALTLHERLMKLVNESLSNESYFVEQTKALIYGAMPTLQRDLGWGDYLANLTKEICNTVTKAASFGFHGGFFDTKKSDAVEEAEILMGQILTYRLS